MKYSHGLCFLILCIFSGQVQADKPNIILVFADDISAREFPTYGSTVWSDSKGKNSQDPADRAATPVLDKLATDGCWITQTWAATVCSPSRAMMMTGRYAHHHKWWHNGDLGRVANAKAKGRGRAWPLYESSPLLIGHVAQNAGYGTYWSGKTQMKGSDLQKFGFDEGCFTPGEQGAPSNPHTDFVIKPVGAYKGPQKNLDNGEIIEDSYGQFSWYWQPHVRLMNHPSASAPLEWWPNTAESKESFSVNTYGPDVELDFIFDYMDRQHAKQQPFFIYHTTHLGHGGFDWLRGESNWPGTPKVNWDGEKYSRIDPNITGDKGDYDLNDSITKPHIKHHIEYLDYQMWRYQQKLAQMGIDDNTVIIFCADNGTGKYGKASPDRQKGTHVPLMIYAPGMTKQGRQDVMVNLSDMLPMIADIAGFDIPQDYQIDGVSLWPFLTTAKETHRDWVYAYRGPMQLIRGRHVMKDGRDNWWDVSEEPADLISYSKITNWKSTLAAQNEEKTRLQEIMQPYDRYDVEHDAPGFQPKPGKGKGKKQTR